MVYEVTFRYESGDIYDKFGKKNEENEYFLPFVYNVSTARAHLYFKWYLYFKCRDAGRVQKDEVV